MKTCLIRSSSFIVSGLLIFTFILTACQKKSEDVGSARSGSTSSGTSALGRAENSDTVITAKVKAALINDHRIKAMDIHVDTNQGEVTLSGLVNSSEQIDQAIQIVKNIEGVKKVNNKMSVKKS